MLTRLKRTIGTLLAVLAAFWAYRLVAEPFIEPKREVKRVAGTFRPKSAATRSDGSFKTGSAAICDFFPKEPGNETIRLCWKMKTRKSC